MKKYKLDVVNFYDDSDEVVAYGTKGHHDFDEMKKAVLVSEHDDYHGILEGLKTNGHVIHTWHKRIPTSDMSVEVKAGVRGATPYTVWCVK